MHIFRTHTLRFTLLSRKRGTNRCKATMQTQTGGDVQQQKHGGKQERKKGGTEERGAQTVRGKRFVGWKSNYRCSFTSRGGSQRQPRALCNVALGVERGDTAGRAASACDKICTMHTHIGAQQSHSISISQPTWGKKQQQAQVVPVIPTAAVSCLFHLQSCPSDGVRGGQHFGLFLLLFGRRRIKLTDAVFLVLRGYPHVSRRGGVGGHPRERRLKRGARMLGNAFYGRASPRYVLLAVIV